MTLPSRIAAKALFIAALLALAALLSGAGLTLQTAQAAPATQPEEILLVRGVKSVSETQVVYLEVRGRTDANRMVHVKSEVSGMVEALPGEQGQIVSEGDLLCRLALDTRQEEYDEAQAKYESAEIEYEGVLELNEKNLQAPSLVAKAKSQLAENKTRLSRARLALERTKIVAPFDGVVVHQSTEKGAYLSRGEVCVTMMELDPLIIVGQAAEKDVVHIATGDRVEVKLVTGDLLPGKVTFVGHAPDQSTRTFPIEVMVDNPDSHIRAGLTAEMNVAIGTEDAHLISPASLVLDDTGHLGVHVVDSANRVEFMPVAVVDESPLGILVKGLPREIDLITVGHEEVYDGQQVDIDFTPLGTQIE